MRIANAADIDPVLSTIDRLVSQNGYAKVFAKVPAWAAEPFLQRGYQAEARVPRFFQGEHEGLFLCAYPDAHRGQLAPAVREEIDQVLAAARAKSGEPGDIELAEPFSLHRLTPEDAEEATVVFRAVFESYPFPIFDPDYIRETMETHIIYFGVRSEGRLVGVSSCEMYPEEQNVEMTDFAVFPEYRGQKLAQALLTHMERQMAAEGMKTFYTIARSHSFGMNVTFARGGYAFGGTLINNTNICGSLESMNVWYRPAK
jgi:putative beta-lysine N-acetyltransferase